MTLISPIYWGGMPFDFRRAPEGAVASPVKLRALDYRECRGLLWSPSGERASIGVLAMHPRVDFTRHYVIPRLTDASIAVLALNGRASGDDSDAVHEELILDVAAGVRYLRDEVGVERVILLGNSGGGSLMALYQAEAEAAPADRIARTPAGAPTLLPRVELSPADGLMLIAAHRGQGHVLLRTIDPSVIDEADLDATDPHLDMYDVANGFREPPESTHYASEFVATYREAQRARIARLDAYARDRLEGARAAHKVTKVTDYASRPFEERQRNERALHARHVMVIYRTMANLDYADPTLDPSPRGYGSLLSERPDLMNRSLPGFSRVITPRAWLSTWSALSSNADLQNTLPRVEAPVLCLHAEADKEIFPTSDVAVIVDAIRAEDRTLGMIEGAGHYFEPPVGEDDAPDVERLMDIVIPWIEERWS